MPKIKIKNLNTEINRRIKLIKTATSVVDIGQQQGAVVNQSDYVGICLSPSSDILGCEGAVDHITVGTITDGGIINVYLNDQWLNAENIFFFRNGGASDLLRQAGIQVAPLTSEGLPATDSGEGRYYDAERARLVNTTPDYKKIRIELLDANSVDKNFTPENGSFEYNPDTSITTFCLAPQNVPIGCAGATPTADTGGIWGSIIMTVNDVPHEGANSIPDLLYIDNHGEELHNTFKNLSDQYLRIHITATELNQADHGWNENQNPTRSVDFNTGTIDFCLAPLDEPVISCEGATNQMWLDMDSFLGVNDKITVAFNEKEEVFTNQADFKERFNNVFDPAYIRSDFDHYFIEFFGFPTQRVTIKTDNPNNPPPIQLDFEGTTNPTFHYDSGVLSFCLRPGI